MPSCASDRLTRAKRAQGRNTDNSLKGGVVITERVWLAGRRNSGRPRSLKIAYIRWAFALIVHALRRDQICSLTIKWICAGLIAIGPSERSQAQNDPDLECRSISQTANGKSIAYKSPEGKELIKKCGVPAPPIRAVPILQAETPRTVAARDWRSPYCSSWTDGCETCVRSESLSKSTCHPNTKPGDAICRRQRVSCSSTNTKPEWTLHGVYSIPDYSELDRLCSEYVLTEIYHFSDGKNLSVGTIIDNDWLYKQGSWVNNQETNEYINPTAIYLSHWSSVRIEYKRPDIECLRTYQ